MESKIVNTIREINPQELKNMLGSSQDFFLIDVRDPEEYEEGHIERSIFIPLHTLSEKVKGLRKDKQIVLYCYSGKRSKQACYLLKEAGYTNIKHLEGGYEVWLQNV